MSKRPPPPNVIGKEMTSKRFATSSGRTSSRSLLPRPSGQDIADDGDTALQPSDFNCAAITSDTLIMANIPERFHAPFISRFPRVIPTPALTMLQAVHGDNAIRCARGQYYIVSAIAYAFSRLSNTGMDRPLLAPIANYSRSAHQESDTLIATILFRFFTANPFFLLHAFAPIDIHRALPPTDFNLLAPCPFCYSVMTVVQDNFRGAIRCPRDYKDLQGSDRYHKQCINRLLTNRQLQTHCDTAELSYDYPETDRIIFVAAHRLYLEVIDEIRRTYQTDFIPHLDVPLTTTELEYLREQTQDFTYNPDLTPPNDPNDTDAITQDLQDSMIQDQAD
jgi:hypothetical protein